MVEVNGKEIQPQYLVDAFEEYHLITKHDLLFEGGAIDSYDKRVAFAYVGIKHGKPGIPKLELKEIRNMNGAKFIEVFTACLEAFNQDFEVEYIEADEKTEDVKKN